MGKDEKLQIRQIRQNDAHYQAALHQVLGVPAPFPPDVDLSVGDLLDQARCGTVSIDLLFGGFRGDRLHGACLGLESPGGVALVLAPQDQGSTLRREATVGSLVALQEAAWQRKLVLLQGLAPRHARDLITVFESAGFRRFTNLVYLTRLLATPMPDVSLTREITWLTWSPSHAHHFAAAIADSYRESLDCPELTGLRDTAQVLQTHRARAQFDPSLWWVALAEGKPVGLVLLNRLPRVAGLEVVYLGVAQASRRSGVAHRLLHKAVETARDVSAKYLTLAVDERNAPALHLYRRWGFEPGLISAAFLATPGAQAGTNP